MSLAEDQKVVVKAINRVRAKAGLPKINKLKKGIPTHAGACPVAMSLAGTGVRFVAQYGFWNPKERSHRWQELGFDEAESDAIKRVIRAIDDGKFPLLEIPKTPVKIKYPGDRKATVIE